MRNSFSPSGNKSLARTVSAKKRENRATLSSSTAPRKHHVKFNIIRMSTSERQTEGKKMFEEQKSSRARSIGNGKFSRWCALAIKIISRENVLSKSASKPDKPSPALFLFSSTIYTTFFHCNVMYAYMLLMCWVAGVLVYTFSKNLYITQSVRSHTHPTVT